MILNLKRMYYKEDYTIGKLYIDGIYFCDTLEDKDRGLKDNDNILSIKAKKVFGKTAIPKGTYKVILNESNRFKKILPFIVNVKGFEGIRIHQGNLSNHTEGCILVGRNTIKGMITHSFVTLTKLIELLKPAKDITIIID
ncbi:DUF5675 family protein [Prevotella sp.]|uniref:DUF5675 family protein n=1 Tax=Prevotella sp. TaxID=59823 RepID=UPI002F93F1ED